MSPDLRVAGSLWLDAFEAARTMGASGNYVERLRKLPPLIEDLNKCSGALFTVLEEEIESARDTSTIPDGVRGVRAVRPANVRGVYAVQPEKMPALLELVVELMTTFEAIETAESAPRGMYERLEAAERGLKKFLTWSELAGRRVTASRVKAEAEAELRALGRAAPFRLSVGRAETKQSFYSPPLD